MSTDEMKGDWFGPDAGLCTDDLELPPPLPHHGWTPPRELIEYLLTLISPPDERALYMEHLDHYDLKAQPDNSICGIITRGTPTVEQSAELLRVLKPGAHFLLIAPDAEPWGITGACNIEDAGFEIRDAIAVAIPLEDLAKLPSASDPLVHPFYYVPKADRGEREKGCYELEGQTGAAAVGRKEGTAGLDSPRAGAGRTAGRIKNVHPCLHPDALVMTTLGFRPISEVTVKHKVLSADGLFHAVEAVSRHPHTSPDLFEISVRGVCHTELATDNHPFLIWRPARKKKSLHGGSVQWLPAAEMQKGDYTMTPVFKGSPTTLSLRPSEWWFAFGLYLAEGCVQRAGHGTKVFPSFSLHVSETHLVDKLRALGKVSVYPKPGSLGIQVLLWDSTIGEEFLRLGGSGAAFKMLDPSLWGCPADCLLELFEGWLAGDGGKVRTYRQAKTVSPDLASQMFLLGEMAGYKSNLFLVPPPPPGTLGVGDRKFKSVLPCYTLQFHPEESSTRKHQPRTVDYEGVTYTLRYVKAVTRMPYSGEVWNLTVKDSPTFQTAVGMSHNTVKPVELMERLLHDVPRTPPDFQAPPITADTKASDLIDPYQVLDPFTGSGSTGLACIETGHNFRGMEREKAYLEIATARARTWQADTSTLGDRARPVIISDVADTSLLEEEPKENAELDWF